MFPILFSLVFLAGNVLASPQANHYIESVLNTALRNEIRALKLDPADLSDFTTEFKDKMLFVKVKGKAEYSKGKLTGLSEVKRITECQGPYLNNGVKSINCSLSFSHLEIEYEGKFKYGKMPKINIKGKAGVTNSIVYIEVTSQQLSPTNLKNFLFQKIGQLSVKFTGLGPLNKHVKFLEDGFRAHLETEVYNSIGQRFQFALNQAVTMVPMPN